MIDLHCHSDFSDGELSPEALLQKAFAAKVRVLALTDHDTTDGLLPLRQAAAQFDIQIINGIELSVRWKKYDIHIIGLHVCPDNAELKALITLQNDNRIERAHEIAHRLASCGVEDAFTKASMIAGHQRIARPHFAQVLVDEGCVPDIQTAFKRFLGQGRAAYVPTEWLSLEAAVGGIIAAGGQAVIAHPLKYDLTRSKLYELILAFKAAGGVGMEVVSGAMTETQAGELAGICTRFELLASTGSDYHGDSLSYLPLGRQRALPSHCTPIWTQWQRDMMFTSELIGE